MSRYNRGDNRGVRARPPPSGNALLESLPDDIYSRDKEIDGGRPPALRISPSSRRPPPRRSSQPIRDSSYRRSFRFRDSDDSLLLQGLHRSPVGGFGPGGGVGETRVQVGRERRGKEEKNT